VLGATSDLLSTYTLLMTDLFVQHNEFLLRRKVFRLIGASFEVFTPDGQLALYVNQKGFKLREDIRAYADKEKTQELLVIRARQIIDFSAAYDVFDPSGALIGTMRRKGFKSIIRDEWKVLDVAGNEVAVVKEDSTGLALVRRFLTNLIPQSFRFYFHGDQQPAVEYRQKFNLFVYKLNIQFMPPAVGRLDKRMGLAAAILIAAIEGRQQ